MNRRQFSNSLIIGVFSLATFGLNACSKDDDPVPVLPKTDEEIYLELKEELKTTMKFNTSYKSMFYSPLNNPEFKSAADFNRSLRTSEDHNENTQWMAPSLLINNKGNLVFSNGGDFYFYEKYTLKKEGDIVSIKGGHEDAWQFSKDGKVSKSTEMKFAFHATYNLKTGESLGIYEAWVNDAIFMVMAYEWVQDKRILKPIGRTTYVDPSTFIFQ